MLESDAVTGRRSADIISKNISDPFLGFYLAANVLIWHVAASIFCNTKSLNFLSRRLRRFFEWVKRHRLPLTETEHVLEALAIAFAWVLRYWVVLYIQHCIPELKAT